MNNSGINIKEKALKFVNLLEIANQLSEYSKERIRLEFDLFVGNGVGLYQESIIIDEFYSELSQILLSHENKDFDNRLEKYPSGIIYKNIIIKII